MIKQLVFILLITVALVAQVPTPIVNYGMHPNPIIVLIGPDGKLTAPITIDNSISIAPSGSNWAIRVAAQPAPSPPIPLTQTQSKFLILLDLNNNYPTTDYVASHRSYLDTLPVDGLAIYLTSGVNSTTVLNPSPVSVATFTSAFSAVSNLPWVNVRQNLALMYSPGAFLKGGTMDAFDNAAWAVSVQNIANFGQAVKAAGLKGIIFDNENYSGYAYAGPGAPACDTNVHTLGACQDQMRLRGQQLMTALESTFPGVDLVFTTDINVSNSTMQGDWQSAPSGCSINDIAGANNLLGAFEVGFIEGRNGAATVTQGGEWTFCAHLAGDFKFFLDWQQSAGTETTLCDGRSRATGCAGFMPVAERSTWRAKSLSGSAIYGYNNMDASGNPLVGTGGTAETVTNALNAANRYAWLYEDVGGRQHGSILEAPGSTPNSVTQPFLDAIRAGKAAVSPK